jgi:long-subunit fatty acid transport protein
MRNPIFGARAKLALGLGAAAVLCAGSAKATTVEEVGDNGSEQMGRGGAWVARASDPLAAFYNPAGLAGQETRLTLQANVNIMKTCFTRLKATNDTTQGDGTAPGKNFPQVCNGGTPFPDPQIAFTYRLNPRVGLGFAIVAPSASGQSTWPDSNATTSPQSPQRYLLTSANTLLLTPTLAIGAEVVDRLRLGIGLIWGFASVDFSNYAMVANEDKQPAGLGGNDVKAELQAKDIFIPGVVGGALWSPTDQIDIAGWYKFISDINAKGNVITTTGSGKHQLTGDTLDSDCGVRGTAPGTCSPNSVAVKVPIPMEGKLGFRFHQPRAGADMVHRRDPMSQDVYDIEADLTWAHDSQFQAIDITIPNGIPVPGITGSFLPPNASVPHNYKDVVGARFGGDYNILPDQFAVRAGAYFETSAQAAQYQNIDFAGQQRIGIAGGATYRVHLGDAPKSKAIEFSVGLGHTFIATSSNTNPNGAGLSGLAGTLCLNAAPPVNGVCPGGTGIYRSAWPVNLGTITNAFTQINVGASYRF